VWMKKRKCTEMQIKKKTKAFIHLENIEALYIVHIVCVCIKMCLFSVNYHNLLESSSLHWLSYHPPFHMNRSELDCVSNPVFSSDVFYMSKRENKPKRFDIFVISCRWDSSNFLRVLPEVFVYLLQTVLGVFGILQANGCIEFSDALASILTCSRNRKASSTQHRHH
jgi:hypothetical protein